MNYILISKKQCTFRYLFMYIIYRAVLIPNYKCTYYQRDQIEKIIPRYILIIGPIPKMNTLFLIHTRE